MASELQRYNIDFVLCGIVPRDDGFWVKHAAAATLLSSQEAEIERLTIANDALVAGLLDVKHRTQRISANFKTVVLGLTEETTVAEFLDQLSDIFEASADELEVGLTPLPEGGNG